MATFLRTARTRREALLSERIPYTAHVAPSVVRTFSGDYVQTFRLGGASFETADISELNVRQARLNVLWRTIASPHLAVWTHIIRRVAAVDVPGVFPPGFAQQLHRRYEQQVRRQQLMQNELYVSLVYRPAAGRATGLATKLLTRSDPGGAGRELADSLERCAQLRQLVLEHLDAYEPEVLGVVKRDGRTYSSLLEFFACLIDSEPRPVPLPVAPLTEALGVARPIFGVEAIEYRLPSATRVGAMLGIREYASATVPGMLDGLLSAPIPLILTQSFTFLSRAVGQGLLVRQYNQLKNAGDFAVSQAEALHVALDELSGGEWVMGDHHWSLQVLADLPADISLNDAAGRLKPLNDRLAAVMGLLVDTEFTLAREDLGMEAAWWSQLPGVFTFRPRKAPLTSRNFASLASCHNYPAGRATGNFWGEAAALLVTSAQSPFHFSLHASDPRDTGGGRRDVGHTLILGPTGAGKTVWIAFLLTMLTRFGATQIVIDKDCGLEILVRALGGVYSALKNGQPTGFNPLQLPVTPSNLDFLRRWLRVLVRRPDRSMAAREEADLDQALHGVMQLDVSARRLSRVLEFLDVTDSEGMCARLSPWCAISGGNEAWVFDHPNDIFIPRLAENTLIGVDVTDFLDHARVRTPITLYLLHLVRSLLGTRRVVCWADEFSRLVSDEAFRDFAQDGLQVWRKLDGVFSAAAQSPRSVLSSPIAGVVLEQTATKLFMSNPAAVREDYVDGCGLSDREFYLIQQELRPGSCLIRQGRHSVVCELDLTGCDDELAIMSGRASSVALMHQLIDLHGPDPNAWLPEFMSTMRRRPTNLPRT